MVELRVDGSLVALPMAAASCLRASLPRVQQPVAGVRAIQVDSLEVDSERPLGLALEGKLDGSPPGRFEIVARSLRVIVPRRA